MTATNSGSAGDSGFSQTDLHQRRMNKKHQYGKMSEFIAFPLKLREQGVLDAVLGQMTPENRKNRRGA
jgi:hypothetical protein